MPIDSYAAGARIGEAATSTSPGASPYFAAVRAMARGGRARAPRASAEARAPRSSAENRQHVKYGLFKCAAIERTMMPTALSCATVGGVEPS